MFFPTRKETNLQIGSCGYRGRSAPPIRPGATPFSLTRVANLAPMAVRASHRCIWYRTNESERDVAHPETPSNYTLRHTIFLLLAVSKLEGSLLKIFTLVVTGTRADIDSHKTIRQEQQQREPQPQKATTPSSIPERMRVP